LVLPAGRRAFLKPVMASVGIGNIEDRHVKKHEPVKEMLIVQFGGPAFRIGLGGGAASSMVQGKNTASLDFGSVQRGNAQMAQRIRRVMDACIDLGDENPIESAHDQGAGGIGNVIPELVGMVGGLVNIREVNLGDNSLSVLEIWSAEYQERLAVLIKEESLELFRKICNRERVPCEVLGKVTGDGNITVIDPDTGTVPVKLPLQQILGNVPRKKFHFTRVPKNLLPLEIPALPFAEKLKMVLQQVAVGSKGYLVRKKDRSVGGCVAQQQCCGPMQLPVADFALVAKSHFDLCGTASSIGEKSPLNLIDPAKGARMALAEAILNLAGVVTEGVGNVKTSINWIWAMSVPGQGADLCDAAMALRDAMRTLQGGECLGGKDSLSAAATVNGETIASPGQCIVTTIVGVDDIRKKVTPDLKGSYGTHIGFFDISLGNCRLGGSAFAQALGQIGNDCPDVDMTVLRRAADAIRELVDRELIISGHDRSDGGLITAAVEMALAGNRGVDIEIRGRMDIDEFLLNEEAGYVVEYDPEKTRQIGEVLSWHGFEEDAIKKIGRTMATSEFIVTFSHYDATILALRESLTTLRAWWESTSNRLELEQKLDPDCAREQEESQRQVAQAEFSLTFVPKETPADWLAQSVKPKVAIIRDIGSNGDAEMVSAFTLAGFDAVGVNMTDLNDGRITLKGFRGIAFVGGFSNADVFGSAKGWAAKIKFSPNVSAMFQAFYEREDTFSFGVCNGCQLMALLGWIPGDIEDERRQVRFMQNKSKRFDSRWVRMRIEKSPAMMFRGMEGSVLGGIVAHGEGRFFAPDGSVLDGMLKRNLVPVVYVDGQNQVTQKYPYNPNGSPEGIAAACSPNGRHLAMMPHPERTFKMWQWHYAPPEYGVIEESPWLTMFQNARRWCEEVREV
jgi:phosphoribosylformylglycinamidine synthase